MSARPWSRQITQGHSPHEDDMRKRQVTTLLSLLIGFFLYCDVALCLLGLDLDFFGLAYYPPFFQIGVLTAQVALLATWAAFGTESIYVRLPRTVFLTCLVCLASAWGLKSNQGGIVGGELWLLLVILCQFPVALIVLMLLRKFRDWRLVAPSTTIDPREDKKRFSLSRLFIWQTQAALVLLFFALFIRESIFNEFLSLQTVLLYVLLITVLVSIALSFPLAFAINLAIGTNRRRSSAFALLLSIGFAIGLFALLLYFVEGSLHSSNEIRREIVMFLGHYFTVFAVLLFIRSIGIRLIRVPNGDPKEPITVPILSEQQAKPTFYYLSRGNLANNTANDTFSLKSTEGQGRGSKIYQPRSTRHVFIFRRVYRYIADFF